MNILYLLKVLGTDKLSELVTVIDAPPIDINLALWDAVEAGWVEIDEKKDRITALKEAVPSRNIELSGKLLKVIQHYADHQMNITRGRLNMSVQDPMTHTGYPMHEYFITLQWLIDNGDVVEQHVKVPAVGKRPYKEFDFLGLPGDNNEEWNAKAIAEWIANWKSTK